MRARLPDRDPGTVRVSGPPCPAGGKFLLRSAPSRPCPAAAPRRSERSPGSWGRLPASRGCLEASSHVVSPDFQVGRQSTFSKRTRGQRACQDARRLEEMQSQPQRCPCCPGHGGHTGARVVAGVEKSGPSHMAGGNGKQSESTPESYPASVTRPSSSTPRVTPDVGAHRSTTHDSQNVELPAARALMNQTRLTTRGVSPATESCFTL